MPEAKTDQRAAAPRFDELLARAEALIPTLRERAPAGGTTASPA